MSHTPRLPAFRGRKLAGNDAPFIGLHDTTVATGANDPREGEQLLQVPVNEIVAAPWQPRKHFSLEGIEALADSLVRDGVLQPLTVRINPEGPGYQLIFGERRLRAARLCVDRGLTRLATVPARLADVSNLQAQVMTLTENLAREDQHEWEIALGYWQLKQLIRNLEERDIPARELASYTPLRHVAVSEYVAIGQNISEAVLREAGFVDAEGKTDFHAVGRLTKKALARIAKLKTGAARIEALRRLVPSRVAIVASSSLGGWERPLSRFEQAWRVGSVRMRVDKPCREMTPSEAEAKLNDMHPVLRALALRAFGQGGGVLGSEERTAFFPSDPGSLSEEVRERWRRELEEFHITPHRA
jgi:ParB/RepB/Spo0J family partition protein